MESKDLTNKQKDEEIKRPKEKFITYKTEDIKQLDEFKEDDYQNRKYHSNNLENALNYFKLRFIKRKLEEAINKNISNNKEKKLLLIKLTEEEKERLFQYDKLNLYHNKIKKKYIQKYTYLFLILIEKSIIYFNFKNFEESYKILKDYSIVQNQIEFGEILLTINGYDKELIGEFLFKEIESKNEDVLNGFLQSIDRNYYKDLFEYFRFIYSRLKFPSIVSKKGAIISKISLFYYNINKDNKEIIEIYKNKEYVGAFINTIINTINSFGFTEDEKITREKFPHLANFIKEDEMLKIYDKIINEPFSVDNDYLTQLYQKFSLLLKENENNINNKEIKELNNIELREYYLYLEEKEFIAKSFEKENNEINNYFKSYKMTLFDSFTQKEQQILTSPKNLCRISGSNTTISKQYLVLDNFNKIAFEKEIEDLFKLKNNNNISIEDIIDIYMGTGYGENFKKYLKSFPKEEKNQNNYMSIICNKEQIDLKSNDPIELIKWYYALKCLINYKRKKKKSHDKNKDENYEEYKKIKEEIESIWNNYILGKWETYGNYLLFKCIDHCNYFSDLYFDGKQEITNIKNEIIEVKKSTLIKAINNYFKETKEKLTKKGILDYNDFIIFCLLGISESSRSKIWPMLTGNTCGITDSLYESLKKFVNPINSFDDFELKFKEDINIKIIDNSTINQMLRDIIKIKYLFMNEILENKIELNKIMSQVYMICRCFYFQRFDITYNKNIINILYFLLIKKISEKNAFILINNLISSNGLISHLYLWKEKLNLIELSFNENFEEHLPRLFEHFKKLGITCDLYLYDWIEGLFTQILNLEISSIIFDLYLIFGDYILIQTSITILKLLEEDLLNLTINEIFKELKIMPFKLEYLNFFDTFKNYYSIKEKFINACISNEIAIQKPDILEIMMNN